MLIYDYKNQELVDFDIIFIVLSMLFIGFIFLIVFSKNKPEVKQDISTRLLGLTKQDLIKNAKLTPVIFRMMGIGLIVGSLIFSFVTIKDFIYLSGIEYFEDIELISGRVENVETRNVFGIEQTTIRMNNKSFHIIKDKRYMTQRNLLQDDSIKIEYFVKNEDSKLGESQYFEVIRIELK